MNPMLRALLFSLALFSSTYSYAHSIDEVADTTTNQQLGTQASFPGGMAEFNKFIRQNLHYPEIAMENLIEGKVVVKFTVEVDGSISNIAIVEDIGAGCGKEVVRIVNLMPNWVPSRLNGENIPAEVVMPIMFSMGLPDKNAERILEVIIFKKEEAAFVNERFEGGVDNFKASILDMIRQLNIDKFIVEGKCVDINFYVDKAGKLKKVKVQQELLYSSNYSWKYDRPTKEFEQKRKILQASLQKELSFHPDKMQKSPQIVEFRVASVIRK